VSIRYLNSVPFRNNSSSEVEIEPWNPPNIDDWVKSAQGSPIWLLKDLLSADAFAVVSGHPKTAKKTFWAFQAALSVASGKPFGPMVPMGQAPVLILEKEGTTFFTRRRWEWLSKSNGVPLESLKDTLFFSHREPLNLDDPEWVLRISDFIARKGIKLVVVDSLARAMTGDENNARDIGKINEACLSFREVTKCTCMVIHHLNKGPMGPSEARDVDMELRGSSALAGAYDQHFALRLCSARSEKNNLIIRGKDHEELKYIVDWTIDVAQGRADMSMLEYGTDATNTVLAQELVMGMLSTRPYESRRLIEMLGIGNDSGEKLVEWMLENSYLISAGGSAYQRTNREVTNGASKFPYPETSEANEAILL
jgi:hypothetical protein